MAELTVVRGRVVTPESVIDDGAVVLDGTTIAWVGPAAEADDAGFPAVAAAPAAEPGVLVLPGLVDLHCHGGGGASFPDATSPEDALLRAGRPGDGGEPGGVRLDGGPHPGDRGAVQDDGAVVDHTLRGDHPAAHHRQLSHGSIQHPGRCPSRIDAQKRRDSTSSSPRIAS